MNLLSAQVSQRDEFEELHHQAGIAVATYRKLEKGDFDRELLKNEFSKCRSGFSQVIRKTKLTETVDPFLEDRTLNSLSSSLESFYGHLYDYY